MTKKTLLFILIPVLILSFSLSACQPAPVASPTSQTAPTLNVVQQTEIPSPIPATVAPTSTAALQTEETAYPAPQPAAYPYPGALMPLTAGGYPAPYPGGSNNGAEPSMEPYLFKTSEPGTATLHGVMLVTDPMQSRPKEDDSIFLVPLAGEEVMTIPPFEMGTVPQAEVNEVTGEFAFTNIAPGRYAVVVLTAGDAQIPARFFEQGSFAIVTVKDSDLGQTIELDYLYI